MGCGRSLHHQLRGPRTHTHHTGQLLPVKHLFCLLQVFESALTRCPQLCSGVSVFKSQSYIASYCISSARGDRSRSPGAAAANNYAIHVSRCARVASCDKSLAPTSRAFAVSQVAGWLLRSLLTGGLLQSRWKEPCASLAIRHASRLARFSIQVALQDCTCLVYCEEHGQLLTGPPAASSYLGNDAVTCDLCRHQRWSSAHLGAYRRWQRRRK